MSPKSSSKVPAPRQYRPTYTKLPSSTSTSNFGSPFPRSTAQTVSNTRRRRTTSVLTSTDHLHSAPTVAASGFTASVSTNDISHPTPKQHRLSIPPTTQNPTRIPTPTPTPQDNIFSPVRSTSSPAVPQKLKENVLLTTHRLLGPIMPGPPHTLTKSRTMNVLSSITSTFSRSTHNLTTSRSSSNNLSLHPTAYSTTSCIPVPAYITGTTNIRQTIVAMPTTYWLGRYQALHDRFRSEFLNLESPASPERRAYWTSSNPDSDETDSLQRTTTATSDNEDDEPEQATCSRAEERLSSRVFTHLDALCVTPEARKSLKAFQQAFARRFACKALLPLGGCMVDEKGFRVQSGEGFIAKAGRLFSGGMRKSGISSSGGSGSFEGAVMGPRKRSGIFGGVGVGFVSGNAGAF